MTDLLSPRRFTSTIGRQPEFLGALPTNGTIAELPPEEQRAFKQRAIAKGALALAEKREAEHGETDLDASLYKLVGNLDSFYEGQKTMDNLRETYGTPRDMPPEEKDIFYQSKRQAIGFNHALHEVINTGGSRFNFDELLGFMTKMHTLANGPESAKSFNHEARTALVGIRNEMAFEQLLIAAGYQYDVGDEEQDRHGGDFIVEGVPIDVKASPRAAELAQGKAVREGRNPAAIMWSHINFEDFEGHLTLPYDKADNLSRQIKGDLDRAITSYHNHQTA